MKKKRRWICWVRFEGTARLKKVEDDILPGHYWDRTQWSPEQEADKWGQYKPLMTWRQQRPIE